jgi:hypothetical protein
MAASSSAGASLNIYSECHIPEYFINMARSLVPQNRPDTFEQTEPPMTKILLAIWRLTIFPHTTDCDEILTQLVAPH